MIVALSVAALLTAAAPTPVGEEKAPSAAEGQVEEKKICRRDQAVGTRLPPRICLTRAQWKERADANRESNRRLIDRTERDLPEPWPPPPRAN